MCKTQKFQNDGNHPQVGKVQIFGMKTVLVLVTPLFFCKVL